ncbi:hypothetical protein LSH36_188g00031 [Paralvinella palmiformis]|uniref:Uncharacterized protein n=1 Tax=Paralvinella palmiformis TaxID=53620 RepID=A0AAD9JQI8_9ANNE|nr:hypothetical protein LSH36_188g00031 [Paralvinella palmiformis]
MTVIEKSAKKRKPPTLRSPYSMEEGEKKRRKLLDTATADVAKILVELSQDSTENSRPSTSSACSASIDTS